MTTKTLRATQSFTFAGRQLKVGDEFQAIDRDAKVLIAIKKAEELKVVAKVAEQPKRAKYLRRDMESEH